jgi:hypothetical protein
MDLQQIVNVFEKEDTCVSVIFDVVNRVARN